MCLQCNWDLVSQFLPVCSHESNMLSISASMKMETTFTCKLFSHEIICNVVLEQLFLSSSQDAVAASEAVSSPLPAVMETLNTDAVIIQGHVDTRAPCL